MGKIRVQDLARMIGMNDQDLVFKLRSIGVRVEGQDALVETDVLKAVLDGKKLATPREVIVRDEESQATAPKRPPTRGPRRPPGPPPRRPRTMIQKVEPQIKTIPAQQRADDQSAAVAKTTEATAPATPPATASTTTPAKPAPAKLKSDKKPADRKHKGRPTAEPEEDLSAYKGAVTGRPDEVATAQATTKTKKKKKKKRRDVRKEVAQDAASLAAAAAETGPITIVEGMTIRTFSDKLGLKSKDLIKMLVQRGIFANINHVLEPDLAQELALELGFDADIVTFEEDVQRAQASFVTTEAEGSSPRAPVVTIMGHVDHGKTTLLDAIRESRVVESEHGGITQHIGAYGVEVGGKKIVFLDTPGHEAFTQLRARGASATDIVVLVVAADDGVMPQTIEAIDHAKAAGVPLLVAVNKIDKSNANPDRVKKELSERGLIPEDWGGDTVMVHLSALQNEGIGELMEMILLTSDMLELKCTPEQPAQGVVLEARKDTGRGTVATVLVQDGTLNIGDIFVSGATWGRVRSMMDDVGERVDHAKPASPVEVTGFQDLPDAGDKFQVVEAEAKARSIAEFRQHEQRKRELAPTTGKISLEQLFSRIEEGEVKELPVVVKTDVQGSAEVLRDTLEKLSTDKVTLKILHSGVGAVNTNNVLLASASDAIVIGFNVRPERNASELADKEGVELRLYTVIYELVDDIKKAMVGLLEPVYREKPLGTAEVRDTFKVPKIGLVAGCHVVEGIVQRNAQARLLRDNVVVYEGRIGSLRRFKDDVSEVRTGFDCGIGLERFNDVKNGDLIEAFVQEEIAQTL